MIIEIRHRVVFNRRGAKRSSSEAILGTSGTGAVRVVVLTLIVATDSIHDPCRSLRGRRRGYFRPLHRLHGGQLYKCK